ncbi:unnamed protein product [Ectocarpus sp. 13 AM-2016]
MNPNITPDDTHTATRLHHGLKNSHCYYSVARQTDVNSGNRKIDQLVRCIQRAVEEVVAARNGRLNRPRRQGGTGWTGGRRDGGKGGSDRGGTGGNGE